MSLKKNYKNVTEQLTSNCSAQIFLTLWTLTLATRAHAVLFEHVIRGVFEKLTFCSLFINRMRPFRDFNHHTVTSINHLFLLTWETWDAALSSLSLSVLRASNDFLHLSLTVLNTFTLQVFAALVRISVWSRHVIVRGTSYFPFRLFGRTSKEFFFVLFSAEQFRLPNIWCIPTYGISNDKIQHLLKCVFFERWDWCP